MAKKTTTTAPDDVIQVSPLRRVNAKIKIVGLTPLFQNRMSEKVRQGFLTGTKKKTAAEKVAIKHDPYGEFRATMERMADGPTALGLRVVALKASMCSAAIETAGLTKAGTQRLLFMPGDLCNLYGIPQLRLDVVRSADQAKTPDIRSRAFLPRWAAEVEISFISPQLNFTAVATLLANAGVLIGIGDYRQEKGKGSFGCFRVADDDDAEWHAIVKEGGRDAQLAAIENPEFADDETSDLMSFYASEARRRAA